MKNPKTTILGVVTIAIAILGAIKAFLTGGFAAFDYASIATQVTTGWALIHAADANPPAK